MGLEDRQWPLVSLLISEGCGLVDYLAPDPDASL
jgi:hypothetical protein